ncbi:MAG TPA: hypothetical protein VHZ77_02790 [Gaiellaceae bacterium]|jgi:hypothetical protein|nr:hypothetical protein [Gaiellaceae bacterium]
MKGKLIRPAVVALAVVGAVLVVGGIAYATIPDASGVIHGCYKKGPPDKKAPPPPDSGALRVVDTDKGQACSNAEIPLDWNQTGPQGSQGPQGPAGPTGPSDVWSVDGYDAGLKNLPFSTPEDLATTSTLPAGSYFVQAETEAENISSLSTDYVCDLVGSSSTYQETRVTSTDWVTVPVQTVVTLTSPDTISLQCEAANTAGSEAFNWQLAAIKVGTVH